jgi:GNAT superfamily N-acetyltransferase
MPSLIDKRSPAWAKLERSQLVTWLDSVLRPRGTVSVRDDLPLLVEDSERLSRRLLVSKGKPVAHAAACDVVVDLPNGSVRAAIVGAVATDPSARRQGLGRRVIEALVEDLRKRDIALAILWADVPAFYEKLGFVLAGRETVFICPKGSGHGLRRTAARPASLADLPAIKDLHARELCRARRDSRTWQALFAMPRTSFYVLERDHQIVAYGVVGRGHDLDGCLHEWGGEELLLPALVCAIGDQRPEDELYVMSPPWKRQAARAMAFHRLFPNSGALGMLRVLDRGALLQSLNLAHLPLPQDHADLVGAVFGSPAEPEPLHSSALPLPFYLFGLDSM